MAAITITQTDIETVFGANFVAQWSSFSQGTTVTADTARIAQACSIAAATVNGKLSTGPYGIPLTANDPNNPPVDIVNIMATYAGWWLFNSRGLNYAVETLAWMRSLKKDADRTLLQIAKQAYYIDCSMNTSRRQTPFVV